MEPIAGSTLSSNGAGSVSVDPSKPAASTADGTSSPLPLAAASRRLRAASRPAPDPALVKRKNPVALPPPPLRAAFIGHVAALAAEGIPIRAIANGLGVAASRVKTALKLPETQLEIAKRRELSKQISSHMLPSITAKGYALAEAAADTGDARSFDAATRGLHALEKIGASVSGEDKKYQVEHSGAVDTGPAVPALDQLKILIGVVTGHSLDTLPVIPGEVVVRTSESRRDDGAGPPAPDPAGDPSTVR